MSSLKSRNYRVQNTNYQNSYCLDDISVHSELTLYTFDKVATDVNNSLLNEFQSVLNFLFIIKVKRKTLFWFALFTLGPKFNPNLTSEVYIIEKKLFTTNVEIAENTFYSKDAYNLYL